MLLVDLDMPKSCADCIFKKSRMTSLGIVYDCLFDAGVVISSYDEQYRYLTDRHPDCDLIESNDFIDMIAT